MTDAPHVPEAELLKVLQTFRNSHYLRHNQRRQEHLATLGLDLRERRVLEVGAGIGDHTTYFLDRGCSVLSVEPRYENCVVFAQMMQELRAQGCEAVKRCDLVNSDVESLGEFVSGEFDVVYCYGLLYHVADPASVLQSLAARCTDLFLLETAVRFGAQESVISGYEDHTVPSQSIHGGGNRPTRPWLFKQLKSLFAHVYAPRTQPAHEEFPTDWTDSSPHREKEYTRAVFVASRRPLVGNPALLDHLPERQTAI
jgi:SAM-dependent methyltransferase